MKKIKILLLTTILVISNNSAAFAADAYMPELIPMPQNSVMFMMVEPGNTQNFNYLITKTNASDPANNSVNWIYCDTFTDSKCNFNDVNQTLFANSILPVCKSDIQEHCIESIAFSKDEGVFVPAVLIKETSGALHFPADPTTDHPGDGSPSLWKSELAAHSGGDNYAASIRLSMNYDHTTKKFVPNTLNASIVPVRGVSGNYNPAFVSGAANNCTYLEPGICGYPQDFPENIRVKLSIRITNKIGGWFQGRLKNPQLEVSRFSNTSNKIVIEAAPSIVPRFAFPRAKSAFTDKEKEFYSYSRWGTANGEGSGPEGGQTQYSFSFIDYFRTLLNETASGVNSYWSLTTTSWGSGSKCLADNSKVQGVVTTNAMGYDGTAPSFRNGFLDYRVSGLHYMPDGKTEVQGTYDLVMRSDTARCLYGFTAAPIYATINVLSGNTSTIVGTTTVSEKNGWLKLAAYGFTFSEKTLQVKITQQKNSKLTITCIKGKLSKKITNLNPKCPPGYKKQ